LGSAGLAGILFSGQLILVVVLLQDPLRLGELAVWITAIFIFANIAFLFPVLPKSIAVIGIILSTGAAIFMSDNIVLIFIYMFGLMLTGFFLTQRTLPKANLMVRTVVPMLVSTTIIAGLTIWLRFQDPTDFLRLVLWGVLGLGTGTCIGVSWLLFRAMRTRWWSKALAAEAGTLSSDPDPNHEDEA
jgi:hypothetical protein